jgi:hypothetical protein
MDVQQTTAGSGSVPLPIPSPLPEILTLQEAARLTQTSPENLRREIRAGRIPFTLMSGRSDSGVLLNTDDLIRVGLLRQPAGLPAAPIRMGRPPAPALLPSSGSPDRQMSAIRIGAYLGTTVVGAATLLFLVLTISSLMPRHSETISSGLSGSLDHPTCKVQPTRARCGTEASESSRKPKVSVAPALTPPPDGSAPRGTRTQSQAKAAPSRRLSSSWSRQPSAALNKPEGPGDYHPIPSNIASDCSRDVTTALSSWIRSVPDHSSVLFPSEACYRIDGTLQITNRTGLTFSGNGTTFSGKRHVEGSLPHVGVYGSTNITFKDLTIRGANPHAGLHEDAFQAPRQWEAAWGIEGSQGILLDSVQAYDVFGDFVTIQPQWVGQTPVTSRNITVRNSRFQRNGRMGIAITGAETVTIRNNYIGEVRHALLDLEPEWKALPINNIEFVGNTTGGVWLLWIANGGICNAGVSNIYVADNVMQADAGMPLFHTIPRSGCPQRGPFTIERNTLIARGSMYAAFDFTRVHDVILRQNRVRFYHDHRTRVLVNLSTSTRVSVLDNEVTADHRDNVVFVTADPGSDYVDSGNRRI